MASIGNLIGREGINDLKKYLEDDISKEKYVNSYAKGLQKQLEQTFGKQAIKLSTNGLKVAYKIIEDTSTNEQIRFIDLKPYFMQSPKAKPTKDGGWYLKIPVGGFQSTTKMRMAYGRSLWDDISHLNFGETGGQNANIERFKKVLNSSGEGEGALAYQWKSTNITRIQSGGGKYGHYITFRTVSNKSDPMSWVCGRNAIQQQVNARSFDPQKAKIISNIIREAIIRNIEQYNQKEAM